MAKVIEIRSLQDPALQIYTHMTKPPKRSAECGLFVAESHRVITNALDAGLRPVSFLTERSHLEGVCKAVFDRCGDTPVYTADRQVLAGLTGYELTRGILCAMERPAPQDPAKLLQNARRIAVLEDITDPTNLGAIFRCAAALGMDAVFISPSCCDPLHRRAVRVSMGAVFQVPWAVLGTQEGWPSDGLSFLHENGFLTAALALRDDAISMDDRQLLQAQKLALVLGTEGTGLREETISLCIRSVKIPMAPGVDSLNVAAASAVAFWTVRPDSLRTTDDF